MRDLVSDARTLRSGRSLPEADRGNLDADLDVDCPTCGAGEGEPCRRRQDGEPRGPHPAREALAG